jgi:hypothetical protein
MGAFATKGGMALVFILSLAPFFMGDIRAHGGKPYQNEKALIH